MLCNHVESWYGRCPVRRLIVHSDGLVRAMPVNQSPFPRVTRDRSFLYSPGLDIGVWRIFGAHRILLFPRCVLDHQRLVIWPFPQRIQFPI